MDLSIVILNWKVKDLLRKCLASVYEHTSGIAFEVFVVDNDSGDGSAEMVASEFPQVKLVANRDNVGFAKGNNQAVERTVGNFVILLNPDTELKSNVLVKMVELMRQRPEIGILGPKLLNADGSLQASVRGFPTFCAMALLMLKLHNFIPWLPPLRRYLAKDFDYEKEQVTDQVMGAAFMIRRQVLSEVGPLDERYFIWFEEVDYCRMAIDAGFQVWYTPQAEIIHHGGESFAQAFGPKKQQYLNDSLLKYMKKHHGILVWVALSALVPISMALAWVVELCGVKRNVRI